MNQRPASPLRARRSRTALVAGLAFGMVAGGPGPFAQTAAPAPAPAAAPASKPAATPSPARGTAAAGAHSPALKSRTPVTLNFVNAEIDAVTRAFAAMLERPIVVDPRVKGTITVYSEQPVTVREAYLNYLSALRGLGFTVVETAGLLKVVPEADAKLQAGTVAVGEVPRRGDQVMTQIFRLNHENANNLVPVLRPLISPNNTINANPSNNTLVITDYAENLQRIARIIAAMDMPAAGDVEVIPLQHAVASDIAPLAQRLADSQPVPGPASATAAGGTSVIADPRSNSLIVRAANPARLNVVRGIVEKLDRPTQGGGPAGNIYVVYLRNADATRLATVLRAAYSGGAAGAGGGAPASLGGSAPVTAAPAGAATTGGGASPQATAPVTPSAAPSTGGFIQADPATNSLIITAPEPVYRQIRAVIDQLDSRRAQVFIESMIVEMDATKAAEFGFQWQGLLGKDGDKNLLAAGTNFGSGGNNIVNLAIGAPSGQVAPGSGLNIGLIRNFGGVYTLAALARFLETNTGANILSTPNLIALDNEEAKFVNGQNVPFVTGQFTNTGTGSGAVNPFQTIERKDVGLTLRVRPQVGEGGKVRMTIFQENSSVVQGTTSSTTNSAGPITNKSSIESTVEIDDGQIMVLGGLLKDEFSNTNDKVPGLGDVPVLGGLFRSESRTRRKTNLMVFLRPVVLRTAASAEQLTLDRYEQIRALQKDAQPRPSVTVPVNEAPVLPPMRAPSAPAAPASAPAEGSAPATQPVR